MLIQKGRISIAATYLEFIKLLFASNQYKFQGMTPEIAELSTQLAEDINKDPADRIIAATSLIRKIPLVTADSCYFKPICLQPSGKILCFILTPV